MPTVDELAAKYGGGQQKFVGPIGIDIDALAEKYSSGPDLTTLPKNIQKFPELESVPTRQPTSVEAAQAGGARGLQDVPEGVMSLAGNVDEALFEGGADRNRLFKQRIANKGVLGLGGTKQYETKYGDNETAAIGRTVGQVIGTAPLVPNAAIARVAGALPVAGATGGKIAAPFINRLLAASGKGAVGGGEFNALNAQTTNEDFWPHVGKGIILGAIGGQIIEGAGSLAGKAVRGVEGLWVNVSANDIARKAGLPLSSVKGMIASLEASGMTPAEAQLALNKLGPKATFMDLGSSLVTEGGGLATFTGKPNTIIKGRMEARRDNSNEDAVKIFTDKFGPRPEVNVEKGILKGSEAETIHKEATRLTHGDYETAKKSTQQLDIKSTVAAIDKQLENAVGEKESLLKEIRGYLVKKDGSLKTSVADLHEVRKELDSVIDKAGTPQLSAGKNALGAVKDVREGVDIALKTNKEMAAADTKFAEHMKLKEGLKIGHDVITKGMNREEFNRVFDEAASTPGLQEKIKRGMLAGAHNMMDSSATGELSSAARMFDKKAVNKANFRKAFGQDADETLDEVHKALTFRNVERGVLQRSHTAEGQAVQQKYGLREKPTGALAEGAKSIGLDALAGSYGMLSIGRGLMTAGKNKSVSMSENRLAQFIEGSADIISRSGAERDAAVSVLSRVKAVQDGSHVSAKVSRPVQSILRLPASAASPVGENAIDVGKKAGDYGHGVIRYWFGK